MGSVAVTQRQLPSSKGIAGVNMRLTAGSFRELHWHTADEKRHKSE
jgi:oxalate decarboxylase